MPLAAIFAVLFTWLTRLMIFKALAIVFTGFLGLASYAFMQRLIDRYINKFLTEITSTDIGFIMSVSRLDDAISILVGALTICAAIKALGIKITSFGAA